MIYDTDPTDFDPREEGYDPSDEPDSPEYIKYCEEQSELHERLLHTDPLTFPNSSRKYPAVAFDAQCDGPCNTVKPILYSNVCYTIGRKGDPGAEQTDFHICADCLST